MIQSDLFACGADACGSDGGGPAVVPLGAGAAVLRGFALSRADALIHAIGTVAESAPFRHLETRGGGQMSAAMTNCGMAGWVSDRRGYRYSACDPLTGAAWPAMPPVFADVAVDAAGVLGFTPFAPEVCLINRYRPGARLGLHQDRDEGDRASPIVSVSLGIPAIFLWGGAERGAAQRRVPVFHGDVVVWGGPSRMVFHGVAPISEAWHPATGALRYNLTFRTIVRA